MIVGNSLSVAILEYRMQILEMIENTADCKDLLFFARTERLKHHIVSSLHILQNDRNIKERWWYYFVCLLKKTIFFLFIQKYTHCFYSSPVHILFDLIPFFCFVRPINKIGQCLPNLLGDVRMICMKSFYVLAEKVDIYLTLLFIVLRVESRILSILASHLQCLAHQIFNGSTIVFTISELGQIMLYELTPFPYNEGFESLIAFLIY